MGIQMEETAADLRRERSALYAENERLRAEIGRLRAALKPFAEAARHFAPYPTSAEGQPFEGIFTLGQIRAAARANEQKG